jgi:hypothetical protein
LSWLVLNLSSQARILSPLPGSAKLAAAKVMVSFAWAWWGIAAAAADTASTASDANLKRVDSMRVSYF